jgi:hypothetical protein
MDAGLNICVLGKEWRTLTIHSKRKDILIDFGHHTKVKANFPMVSVVALVDPPDHSFILLKGREGRLNETSYHSELKIGDSRTSFKNSSRGQPFDHSTPTNGRMYASF